jgi:hypothetical protein
MGEVLRGVYAAIREKTKLNEVRVRARAACIFVSPCMYSYNLVTHRHFVQGRILPLMVHFDNAKMSDEACVMLCEVSPRSPGVSVRTRVHARVCALMYTCV